MDSFDPKSHWENIYQTKDLKQVSWYQQKPDVSLNYVLQFNIPTTAKIIDVGGGDSVLVDFLLDMGYEHITVLDISKTAIDKAKVRLGARAEMVHWIVADITQYEPEEKFDLWHDRAAFHFLTEDYQVAHYKHLLQQSINPNGLVIIGTFSEEGPRKCSGIEIRQYSESKLRTIMEPEFELLDSKKVTNVTPFDTNQDFLFCAFKRKGQP